MDQDFKEIEVKFQLDNSGMEFLKKWLEKNTDYEGEVLYTDYYLDNPDSTFFYMAFGGYKDILQFVRIRMSLEKNFICYKNRHITEEGKTLYCDEYETEVKDGDISLRIFNALGYTEQIILKKKRKTYKTKEFDIVIDDVDGLGIFVEVELKNHELDGIAKIHKYLKEIGIKKIKQFDRGYICMKVNPKHDFGIEVIL